MVDKTYAWFYLYWLRRAWNNEMKAKNLEYKYVSPAGFEPTPNPNANLAP